MAAAHFVHHTWCRHARPTSAIKQPYTNTISSGSSMNRAVRPWMLICPVLAIKTCSSPDGAALHGAAPPQRVCRGRQQLHAHTQQRLLGWACGAHMHAHDAVSSHASSCIHAAPLFRICAEKSTVKKEKAVTSSTFDLARVPASNTTEQLLAGKGMKQEKGAAHG